MCIRDRTTRDLAPVLVSGVTLASGSSTFLGGVGWRIQSWENFMKDLDSCPRKIFINTLFTSNCAYSLRRLMDLLSPIHVGLLILDEEPLSWLLSEVHGSSDIL